jgi:hypothetical protein
MVNGLFEFYQRPDKLARSHGAFGCLLGLVMAPFSALCFLFYGVFVFCDQCLLGIANGCFGEGRLYCFDRNIEYNIYSPQPIECELQSLPRPVGPRHLKLRLALQLATTARDVFDDCQPKFPQGTWHFKVASAAIILAKLEESSGDTIFEMQLRSGEKESLMAFLQKEGTNDISFSRFCLFIGAAVSARLNGEVNPARHHRMSFVERYCDLEILEDDCNNNNSMKVGRRRTILETTMHNKRD